MSGCAISGVPGIQLGWEQPSRAGAWSQGVACGVCRASDGARVVTAGQPQVREPPGGSRRSEAVSAGEPGVGHAGSHAGLWEGGPSRPQPKTGRTSATAVELRQAQWDTQAADGLGDLPTGCRGC